MLPTRVSDGQGQCAPVSKVKPVAEVKVSRRRRGSGTAAQLTLLVVQFLKHSRKVLIDDQVAEVVDYPLHSWWS